MAHLRMSYCWLATLLLAALLSSGCGPRLFSQPGVTATLVATRQFTPQSTATSRPSSTFTPTSTATPATTPTTIAMATWTVAAAPLLPPGLATSTPQSNSHTAGLLASRFESPLEPPIVLDGQLDGINVTTTLPITQLIQLAIPERVPLPNEISAPALNPGPQSPDVETVVALVEALLSDPGPLAGALTETPSTPTELAASAETATPATPSSALSLPALPTVTPTPAPPTPTETPIPTAVAPIQSEEAANPPTPDGVVRTANVPILMYHYLSVPPADADI
ncbi:MAG: hypothetical protein HC802_08395 [Caldilineaceae bacterium]|nr:hypothetical protein [Caldilineaceae bacterium]